jgi:hypothetical protein
MEGAQRSEGQSSNIQINKHAVQAKIENFKLEQNIALGVIGGVIGGGIGAVLWALITYFTERQIGYTAVGVGFLVGVGNRLLGKGIDKVFGITGGFIALASVIIGNFLVSMGFLAKAMEMGYIETLLRFNYAYTFDLMMETFSLIDLLFYAIAVYAGYRYSFRRMSLEEQLHV